MSRIENAAIEDNIASSLLSPSEQQEEQAGPQQEQSEYSVSGKDLLNEEITERSENVFRDGDEGTERLRSERPEVQESPEARSNQNQAQPGAEEQQQAPEPTPEQVQEGIAALDATIEQHGLNDAPSAREFATDFCSAFGTDIYKSGVDVQTLGSTMAKTALSAVNFYEQTGGDLSNLPEIPEASARAFTHDLLTGLGFDPRSVQVNEQMLANTAFRGALNFFDTYTQYGGKITDMAKLNAPESAQMFLSSWLQAFGINRQPGREESLKFADACGKYFLSFLGRRGAAQDRVAAAENQGRQSRGRSRGQRVPAQFREAIKGTKAPRFKTNSGPNDPFNSQVMADYEQRNARL
jgi:hypothetical protein